MKRKWLIVVGVVLAGVVGAERYGRPVMAQVRAALVQNVDEPGRNPFAFSETASGDGGAVFNVPAGKRYVVQQFSEACQRNRGTPAVVFLSGRTNSTSVFLFAPATVTPNGTSPNGASSYLYSATGTTPLYADPGSTLQIAIETDILSSTELASCSFSVSGYVINNP